MMGSNRTAIVIISGMLITLTACATANSSPGSPGSAGSFAPGGGGSAAAASPTAAAATTSKLAHFPFPANVHYDFQTPLPSDPQQAGAVVADDDFLLGWNYAIYSDGKDMRVLDYVDTAIPIMVSSTYTGVQNNKSVIYTGTTRYFDTTVQPTPNEPGVLTVSSCVNTTAVSATSRSTGQVINESNSPEQNVYLESDLLTQVKGSWKVSGTSHVYYPHGAAKGCYP
jgi:hypothetical protein